MPISTNLFTDWRRHRTRRILAKINGRCISAQNIPTETAENTEILKRFSVLSVAQGVLGISN